MNEEEIKKFINKCLDKRLDNFKSGYMRRLEDLETHIRKKLDNDYGNVLNTYKEINDKVNAMQLTLNAQSIGVQNVYNEFSKLTNADFLNSFNHELLKFKNDM